jgi:hypothetical protein
MPLYEITDDRLHLIPQRSLASIGLLERTHLQRALRASISAITPGVRTMVLAEEFGDWVGANRRIDMLCLDEEARLVVVELKRDDGAHMELQALRYAAMISAMRFDQAVEAHRRYLASIGSPDDPEAAIRAFLDKQDKGPVALSDEPVRIILVAVEFPQELTTAVLWLNGLRLDIRCVQMRPHVVDQRTLIDFQQVIPLPAAQQYQVALRDKAIEQSQAKAGTGARDFTRYDLTIGDATLPNLPKRRLIYEVVAEAIRRRNMTPSDITAAIGFAASGLFVAAEGTFDEEGMLSACPGRPLLKSYFIADDELFHVDGKTYAFTNQWGSRTIEAVDSVIAKIPSGPLIDYSASARTADAVGTAVDDEIGYEGYTIRRLESGTIELEFEGESVLPVRPKLREFCRKLGIPDLNGQGAGLNTRQLGVNVMRAVRGWGG